MCSLKIMTDDQSKYSGNQYDGSAQIPLNGDTKFEDGETNVLDNKMPDHYLHSVYNLGTVSSSEKEFLEFARNTDCHKSRHSSLHSDGYISNPKNQHYNTLALELGICVDPVLERSLYVGENQPKQQPSTQPSSHIHSNYSAHTWCHLQEMVNSHQYNCFANNEGRSSNVPDIHKVPFMLNKGFNSSDPGQMNLENSFSNFIHEQSSKFLEGAGMTEKSSGIRKSIKNEDIPSSPTIDESIEQLNKLILDLDPTFKPFQTQINTSYSAASPLNIVPFTNTDTSGEFSSSAFNSEKGRGSPSDSISFARNFCFGQYENDQRDCLKYSEQNSSPTSCSEGSFLSYQVNVYEVDNLFSCLENRDETVPPTPAFPSSPETPYVRTPLSYIQVTEGRHQFSTLAEINKSHETQNYKKSLNSTLLPSDCSIVTNLSSVITEMQGSYTQRPSSTTCNRHESASDDDHHHLWMIRTPRQSLYTQTDDTNDHLDLNSTGIADSRPLLSEMRTGSLTSTNNSPKVVRDQFSVVKDYDNGQRRLNLQDVEKEMHAQHPFREKKRISEEYSFGSNSLSSGFSSSHSDSTVSIPFPNVLPDFSKVESKFSLPETSTDKHMAVKFVQDTSKFWYKPDISRDQAITILKEKEPGSFIIRDSHSFRGAYGLAMKVATPPPSVMQLSNEVEDMTNELVRHFLIECVHKGVRLKGCPNEPYFGSLTALVYQHAITPLALPCKLLIPSKDPLEEITETTLQTAANSAAGLLKQGAACNVWYLNSVEMESLTGYQAVQKALSITQLQEPPPASTVVHFKVSSQGITLTDNQRKLFFRRHYPVSTVIFCSLDPQDRKWIKDGLSAKVFGFVARKGIVNDNVCHLFAEHDPEQPASAIVNFVSKVMIGSQKKI